MKRVTVKKLIKILNQLDKCENMAQVCYMFDILPKEIKQRLEEAES